MTPVGNSWRSFVACIAVVGLAGCGSEVGVCEDPRAARAVVYDGDGSPAYEGQALLIASCGHGSFCHAAAAEGDERYGVPAGLDFDVLLASPGDAASVERLRRAQDAVFAHRDVILAAVESGHMPPPGPETMAVLDGAPRYRRVDGVAEEPLPAVGTEEGRAILQQWLACATPVVQGSEPDESVEPVGYVEPAFEVEPLEPRWTAIYDALIVRRCASAPCHGLDEDGELALGDGPRAAWEALVDQPAAGTECADQGRVRVIPGDPTGSLLVQKLRQHEADVSCGDPMPPSGSPVAATDLEAIITWIAEGASAD